MIRAGLMAQNKEMSLDSLHKVSFSSSLFFSIVFSLGISWVTFYTLYQAVEECFQVMDVNNDGKLSFEEFSNAIMLQPALVKLFVPTIPGFD